MGLIQDLFRKLKAKKENKELYAQDRYIEEDFAERKKSANERELERYYEEARERNIKEQLKKFQEHENAETWSGKKGNPLYAENITMGHKKLFEASKGEVMKNDKKQYAGGENVVNAPNVINTPNIMKNKGSITPTPNIVNVPNIFKGNKSRFLK